MEYSQTTNMAVLRTTYITYPALLSVIVNGEDLFLKGTICMVTKHQWQISLSGTFKNT